MFIKENWFKICLLLCVIILVGIIADNFSRARKANILMFCTKQYDDKAALSSPNTYFGYPDQCLNKINDLVN